jgi:hypothetical protein
MTDWIVKLNGGANSTTVFAAYDDVTAIGESLGMLPLNINFYQRSANVVQSWSKEEEARYMDGVLAGVHEGDTVYFPFPSWNWPTFDAHFFLRLKQLKEVKIIGLLMDFEPLQFANLVNLQYTIDSLNLMNGLVLPSEKIHDWMLTNGLRRNLPVVVQAIYDFAQAVQTVQVPEPAEQTLAYIGDTSKIGSVVAQSAFAVDVWNTIPKPSNLPENIHWQGPFEQRLMRLSDMHVGLVWTDGKPFEDVGLPNYGLINNPFKLSLYLANGIPVIVQADSHAAWFVKKYQLGIAVGSLTEIPKVMQDANWQLFRKNAQKMSSLVQRGHFTRTAILAITESATLA